MGIETISDDLAETLVDNKKSNNEESSDSVLSRTLDRENSQKPRFANIIRNTFRQIRYGFKVVKDTIMYGIYIFKSWMSYTFCYIVTKKKKTPGIIRSVRV